MAPRAKTFAEALEVTAEVYHAAGAIMAERGLLQGVADEGGWWPAFRAMRRPSKRSCDRSSAPVSFQATPWRSRSTSLHRNSVRRPLSSGLEQRELDRDALAEMLLRWCDRYPILSIEDPSRRTTTKASSNSPRRSATAFR